MVLDDDLTLKIGVNNLISNTNIFPNFPSQARSIMFMFLWVHKFSPSHCYRQHALLNHSRESLWESLLCYVSVGQPHLSVCSSRWVSVETSGDTRTYALSIYKKRHRELQWNILNDSTWAEFISKGLVRIRPSAITASHCSKLVCVWLKYGHLQKGLVYVNLYQTEPSGFIFKTVKRWWCGLSSTSKSLRPFRWKEEAKEMAFVWERIPPLRRRWLWCHKGNATATSSSSCIEWDPCAPLPPEVT